MNPIHRRAALTTLAALAAAGCSTPSARPSRHFVLVHGAWHAGWCWDHVALLLRSRGHRVDAIDLPGHGASASMAGQVGLSDYVDSVVRAIDATSGPVTLVAHSLGGVAVSGAAEQRPERIASAVYLAAYLLPSQMALRDYSTLPENTGSLLTGSIVLAADRKTTSVKPDRLQDIFYADCSESDFQSAKRQVGPDPFRPLVERQTLTAARFGRVDKLYIQTTQDRAVMPALQERMCREAAISRIARLPSSHSPFLSMPRQVADLLESA